VGWPDIPRISDYNFAPVIEKALAMPGFSEDTNSRAVMTGFGRNAVLGVQTRSLKQ
jgi:hydroxylamine reductase